MESEFDKIKRIISDIIIAAGTTVDNAVPADQDHPDPENADEFVLSGEDYRDLSDSLVVLWKIQGKTVAACGE